MRFHACDIITMKLPKNQKLSYKHSSDCIRVLASDAIEKAASGHPGMVLGMADVMTILVFNFLKFYPKNPKWFNRDRLVLSAGHGSMLLYSFYYLTGYKDFLLEDLKNFRQLHSKTPGHPEYGIYSAIETTSGPLGQGFANAVGMAIAQKKYQHKLGKEICDYKIYCIVGDGCLMEGISYESASIAGHLRLDNLILLFDDNKISIDGKTSLTISEDILLRFKAQGWNVEAIDGHDFDQIEIALNNANNSDRPYLIACSTVIAKGCVAKEGSEEAHGAPLGQEVVKSLKETLKFRQEAFFIPSEYKLLWEVAYLRNEQSYNNWHKIYKDLTKELQNYIEFKAVSGSFKDIKIATNDQATRAASGALIEELIKNNDKIICGSADLSLSNNIKNEHSKIITANDFSGNFIHFGVRENAMAAIMNGLAVSGFLPICGTFFVFSDYMRPSIRLSSIMNQQVIYVMTHDSIGVGEDGPTHQPVEHLASLRAMPNILVFRPADFIETMECWKLALANNDNPSMLVLTRQKVQQLRQSDKENLCARGAYIFNNFGRNDGKIDISIFSSGSELSIANEVAEILYESGLTIRLISVPCFELFFKQEQEYINFILDSPQLKVAIEAGSSFGWHRVIGPEGMFFGIESFGQSAPKDQLFNFFGLTTEVIAKKIKAKFI